MAYNSIGKLLGNCPFEETSRTPPNDTTPGTPQPDGTKFFARGEPFSAVAINRALAALAENIDDTVSGTVRATDTVYRRDTVVGDGSSIRFQLNDWVYIGDGAGPATTGQPGEFSSVYDPTDNVSYVNASGEMAKITKFEDPASSPGSPINDGTERPHTTSTTISSSEGSRIIVSPSWVSSDDVIPGLHVEIMGSTGGDYDGMYQANNFREVASTEVDLANFRHRLRITGATMLWAVGDVVQDTATGTITGVVKWVDGGTPSDIVELELTSIKDFTGVTGITNATNTDTATVVAYEKPGDPVMLDAVKVDGIATAQVYTDGFSFYQPIAVIRAGTTPGSDALPAATWAVAFRSPRLYVASDEGSRFADLSYINRDTLEDHLKNHPGPGTLGPIKITPTDNRAGYIQSDPTQNKFVAGSNISFSVLNPGGLGDLQLQISASGAGGGTDVRFTGENQTGSALYKGIVVDVEDAQDGRVVKASRSDGEVAGVAMTDIPNTGTGDVQTAGVVEILIETGLVGGPDEPEASMPIWLSGTDGWATTVPPASGQMVKRLGKIIDASTYLGNDETDSLVLAAWCPEPSMQAP